MRLTPQRFLTNDITCVDILLRVFASILLFAFASMAVVRVCVDILLFVFVNTMLLAFASIVSLVFVHIFGLYL